MITLLPAHQIDKGAIAGGGYDAVKLAAIVANKADPFDDHIVYSPTGGTLDHSIIYRYAPSFSENLRIHFGMGAAYFLMGPLDRVAEICLDPRNIGIEKQLHEQFNELLTLLGASGNLLTIRSTIDGSEAFLDLQGSQSVDFVDVKDNHATGYAIYMGLDSVNSGNAPGWIVAALPALSGAALVLLMLVLLWTGHRLMRARQAAAQTP